MNTPSPLIMELVHAFLLGMIGWNIQLTRKTMRNHYELLGVLKKAFPQIVFPPFPEPPVEEPPE